MTKGDSDGTIHGRIVVEIDGDDAPIRSTMSSLESDTKNKKVQVQIEVKPPTKAQLVANQRAMESALRDVQAVASNPKATKAQRAEAAGLVQAFTAVMTSPETTSRVRKAAGKVGSAAASGIGEAIAKEAPAIVAQEAPKAIKKGLSQTTFKSSDFDSFGQMIQGAMSGIGDGLTVAMFDSVTKSLSSSGPNGRQLAEALHRRFDALMPGVRAGRGTSSSTPRPADKVNAPPTPASRPVVVGPRHAPADKPGTTIGRPLPARRTGLAVAIGEESSVASRRGSAADFLPGQKPPSERNLDTDRPGPRRARPAGPSAQRTLERMPRDAEGIEIPKPRQGLGDILEGLRTGKFSGFYERLDDYGRARRDLPLVDTDAMRKTSNAELRQHLVANHLESVQTPITLPDDPDTGEPLGGIRQRIQKVSSKRLAVEARDAYLRTQLKGTGRTLDQFNKGYATPVVDKRRTPEKQAELESRMRKLVNENFRFNENLSGVSDERGPAGGIHQVGSRTVGERGDFIADYELRKGTAFGDAAKRLRALRASGVSDAEIRASKRHDPVLRGRANRERLERESGTTTRRTLNPGVQTMEGTATTSFPLSTSERLEMDVARRVITGAEIDKKIEAIMSDMQAGVTVKDSNSARLKQNRQGTGLVQPGSLEDETVFTDSPTGGAPTVKTLSRFETARSRIRHLTYETARSYGLSHKTSMSYLGDTGPKIGTSRKVDSGVATAISGAEANISGEQGHRKRAESGVLALDRRNNTRGRKSKSINTDTAVDAELENLSREIQGTTRILSSNAAGYTDAYETIMGGHLPSDAALPKTPEGVVPHPNKEQETTRLIKARDAAIARRMELSGQRQGIYAEMAKATGGPLPGSATGVSGTIKRSNTKRRHTVSGDSGLSSRSLPGELDGEAGPGAPEFLPRIAQDLVRDVNPPSGSDYEKAAEQPTAGTGFVTTGREYLEMKRNGASEEELAAARGHHGSGYGSETGLEGRTPEERAAASLRGFATADGAGDGGAPPTSPTATSPEMPEPTPIGSHRAEESAGLKAASEREPSMGGAKPPRADTKWAVGGGSAMPVYVVNQMPWRVLATIAGGSTSGKGSGGASKEEVAGGEPAGVRRVRESWEDVLRKAEVIEKSSGGAANVSPKDMYEQLKGLGASEANALKRAGYEKPKKRTVAEIREEADQAGLAKGRAAIDPAMRIADKFDKFVDAFGVSKKAATAEVGGAEALKIDRRDRTEALRSERRDRAEALRSAKITDAITTVTSDAGYGALTPRQRNKALRSANVPANQALDISGYGAQQEQTIQDREAKNAERKATVAAKQRLSEARGALRAKSAGLSYAREQASIARIAAGGSALPEIPDQAAAGDDKYSSEAIRLRVQEAERSSPIRAITTAVGAFAAERFGGGKQRRERISAFRTGIGAQLQETQDERRTALEAHSQSIETLRQVSGSTEPKDIEARRAAIEAKKEASARLKAIGVDAATGSALPGGEIEKQQKQFDKEEAGLNTKGDIAKSFVALGAGSIAGGLIFGAAQKAVGLALEGLGKGAEKAADALSGFSLTTSKVTQELAGAVRGSYGNAPGAVAGALIGTGISGAGLGTLSPLTNRTGVEAASANAGQIGDAFKAAQYTRQNLLAGKYDAGLFQGTGGIGGSSINAPQQGYFEQVANNLEGLAGTGVMNRLVGGNYGPENGHQFNTQTPEFTGYLKELQGNLGKVNSQFVLLQSTDEKLIEGMLKSGEAIGKQGDVKRLTDEGLVLAKMGPNGQPVALQGTEAGQAVADMAAGNNIANPESYVASRERPVQAAIHGLALQRQMSLEFSDPISQAMGNFSNPLLRPVAGQTAAGAGQLSAGSQQEYTAALDKAGQLQDSLNEKFDKGRRLLKDILKPADYSALEQSSSHILDIQTKIATRNVAQQAKEWNLQLKIAQRQYNEISALSGKQATGEGAIVGNLERQNMLLGRQAQRIQFMIQQRQLNFQRAVAGFQVPFANPQEAAGRVKETEAELAAQQDLLDISKKQFGNETKLVDLQNLYQAKVALEQIGVLVSGHDTALLNQADMEQLSAAQTQMSQMQQEAGAWITEAGGTIALYNKELIAFEEVYGTALNALADTTLAHFISGFSSYTKLINDWLTQVGAQFTQWSTSSSGQPGGSSDGGRASGATGTTSTAPGSRAGSGTTSTTPTTTTTTPTTTTTTSTPTGGGGGGLVLAGGSLFDTAGPTSMTVGEAGTETVAVLRNPRSVTPMNGGGGGSITININNPSVRSDDDIHKIAESVERVLNRKASLYSLRS